MPRSIVTTGIWCAAMMMLQCSVSGAPETLQILERGPHHRKWEYISSQVTSSGQTVLRTNRYTEISTGLHYWKDGGWVETKEEIDIVPGGAMASQGPHQVGFAANLNTVGAVNLVTPDGKRLRSHVLGLAYTDTVSGQSVLFAEVRDTIGELIGNNQILYQNAFNSSDGSRADVRYTYTRAGLEQDVIFRDAPPDPSQFGLPVETTRLEVFTEFVEAPEPVTTTFPISTAAESVRTSMAIPDFVDNRLDFGAMKIPQGQAFLVEPHSSRSNSIPVGKTWESGENRQFLIESMRYSEVKPHLEATTVQTNGPPQARFVPKRSEGRIFERPHRMLAGKATNEVRIAMAAPKDTGVVMDYMMVSGQTNFTFQGDTTYFVPLGQFLLWGTTVIESGTVVKYTNTKSSAIVRLSSGTLDCQTESYRPAVFTSMHDNTVGDLIAGSTGDPTNHASTAMLLFGTPSPTPYALKNARFLHAYCPITVINGTRVVVDNVQLVHCFFAFRNDSSTLKVRNALISDAQIVFAGNTPHTNIAEHITVHSASNFVASMSAPAVLATNSLFVRVTNNVLYNGVSVETNLSGAGVFNSGGAGHFYLATNSPYRNVGTTNVSAEVLAHIRSGTTFAPQTLSNLTAGVFVLDAAVGRDTDIPDLGYHYDPIDYYSSGIILSNATVLLTNGAALAWDYAASSWGLVFKDSRLVSEGHPLRPNRIVRAHMVQEGVTSNPWQRAAFYDGVSISSSNELRLRFTTFAQLAGDGYMLYTGQKFRALEWTHSEVYNPSLVIDTAGGNVLVCGLTNTLWHRGASQIGLSSSSANTTAHVRNNLFKNSTLHFVGAKTNWSANDNLIDGGNVHGWYDHSVTVPNANNRYYQAVSMLSGGSGNATLTNLTYVVGPLGRFYQPTNSALLNAGSTTADQVGLYHFTATTDQLKETNSVVDIGLHWVATSTNGLPNDADADGSPDFIEDSNGNGLVDSGETDWQNAGDWGFNVWITEPKPSSTPLP